MRVLGIDPGNNGALALLEGHNVELWKMPLDSEKQPSFSGIFGILREIKNAGRVQVFLERSKPLAQGMMQAFNYGRGFAAIEIALSILGMPMERVEPHLWAKVMLEGFDARLKPKERAQMAVVRYLPRQARAIERGKRNGRMHDGMVDAMLIAEYGRRKLGIRPTQAVNAADF